MNWSKSVALAASSFAVLSGAQAHGAEAIRFAIKLQSLESALFEFAAQAHVSLSTPPEGFNARTSVGLEGLYKPDAALARLLSGSGYKFERVGTGAYRILATPRDTSIEPAASDEIIIAGRRPTPSGDMPRDVTRFSGSRLRDAGPRDTNDIAALVAGLAFTNLGEGRDKLLLRGISDGALTGRAQSTVGIYLDDTRITYAAPDPDLQLVDIGAVEVLRGPQGALYGAGSIGGMVKNRVQCG